MLSCMLSSSSFLLHSIFVSTLPNNKKKKITCWYLNLRHHMPHESKPTPFSLSRELSAHERLNIYLKTLIDPLSVCIKKINGRAIDWRGKTFTSIKRKFVILCRCSKGKYLNLSIFSWKRSLCCCWQTIDSSKCFLTNILERTMPSIYRQ